jgi:PAS domain S-box-containing protein
MLKMNKNRMLFVFAFFLVIFTGCGKPVKEQPDLSVKGISFRDIPGITKDEINAIEALKTQYGSFTCVTNLNTDAFYDRNGEPSGFTIMFYEWLSELFEIPFKLEFREWNDLYREITSGEIDFTIELTDTPERRKIYFMTSPIAQRKTKIFRIAGSEPLENIINSRKPRYVFPMPALLPREIAANTQYDFEVIFVDGPGGAFPLLKSGEADGYISLDTAEAAFDVYGSVVSEDYFPLLFRSSCLLTQREELQPVISVVEKALNKHTLAYLIEMRNAGYQKYLQNKLYTLMTEEERLYIKNNPVIPIAVEHNNYPVSFFDPHTNQWHGIYFDALDEISDMTGLTFEYANGPHTQNMELITKLENGEALIISELYRLEEYKDRFLWSKVPLLNDNYAFVSKSDFHNIGASEISYLHVGVRKNTPYSELFKKMFPYHNNLSEYETQEEAWEALGRGDIDLIFASRRRLVVYTNYYEEIGYKLNLVFNNSFDTSFGFNKDAAILKSIVDKTLYLISIHNISNQWMSTTYDYKHKLIEAQRPWLIGAVIMFSTIIILVSTLLIKSRSTGRHLETLIKQRTNELTLKTSQLQIIIDTLPDGVFCKDVNLKYTLCNKYMADIFGRKLEDMLGNDDIAAIGMSAESMAIANEVDRRVMGEDRRITFEEWLQCADGIMRLFETVKVPLKMNDKIVGILGIGRDMTKRKMMEDEIQLAARAKTVFLANMSHEIRTPLNVIIGLTDLILEDANLSKHIMENLIKISNAGDTLLDIVNDILDFSKIESGKLELNPVDYYMSSLLNDVITLVITRLGEKPITFHLKISDNLPAKLYGDDLRVKQIFTNLLNNAVKYTHHGRIELSVSCTREGVNTWMEVSVSDTGIGIHDEDLKKIFTDYHQVDTKANRNIEGTGLGLSITKRLTEMMDGKINVESEYGKGSKFNLRIKQGFISDTPIGKEIADKLRNFQYADDKRIVTKKLLRLNLSYAKVLVVDDMQTNLDVAAGLLRKYKMQVDCLSSGQDAIERIRDENVIYNAIFMDHMMPGMDGIETADNIRALDTEYARKVPIIALTANAIHGTEEMFYEHGFQAFISKPIDIIEMDSIIRKWVRNELKERAMFPDGLIHTDTEPSEPEAIVSENEGDAELVIEIQGVNTKKGLSFYGGDTDIYLPLLRSYASNTPGVLKKLKSVTKETLLEYVIAVHGLKGTSAGIGAETIREAALNLETISRAGDFEGVLTYNDKLINDTEFIVANVKAWIEQYDAVNVKPRLKAPNREALTLLRQSCEKYDMMGIDKAMSELESFSYEEGADLIAWLKEKIDISEITEAAERLAQYEKESG